MTVWHAPRTWMPQDEALEAYFEEQVYDNTLWLYDRYSSYVLSTVNFALPDETDTTDYSVAGLTYKTLITFPSFTLLDQSKLTLRYNGAFQHTAARNCQIEPVLSLNGGAEYYYSTGTSTKPVFATQSGLCSFRIPAATMVQSNFIGDLDLAAGLYTLKLGLFVNLAGGTLTRNSNEYMENALLRLIS